MRTVFRNAVRSTLFLMNLNAAQRASDKDIRRCIQKLRPMNCGFDLIRLGGRGDGGYLIPDDLEGIEYCFSPGIDTKSQFESDLADRNIRSFLADYSVDKPAIQRPEFVFDKKFLGPSDRDPYFTLATWKNKYLKDYSTDLLLQMDIEGDEYGVILSTPDQLLNQFRILVIEFHWLDRLLDPFSLQFMAPCFDKLLDFFHVTHIHPNTSCEIVRSGEFEVSRSMEFTFLNKRRVRQTKPQTNFPHWLDQDNVPGKNCVLPKSWYLDQD
ncbi:MAG TPA: hypothetical protein VFU48_02600 [Nitrospira sp.]|nr:hypothetical protein [Nitrospira sp.]